MSGRVKHKKRLILIVIIVIVLVAVGLVTWLFVKPKTGQVVVNGCPQSTLQDAGKNLVNPINATALQNDAMEIEKTPGYEKSADCTFITTFYELNYGSLGNAKTELAKLKAAFNPSKGYGSLIAAHALSPDELQSQIDDAQASIDASVSDPQNSAFTPGPETTQ